MNIYEKTYEIYEAESGVLLVDNLTFEEAAEQSAIYADFFDAQVVVIAREWFGHISHTTTSEQFKNVFISYFGELCEMGNLN